MPSANLVVIVSAGHHAGAMGHAGHPIVSTPNLDRLAAAGTAFDAAFTTSPSVAEARKACAPDRWIRALDAIGYRIAPPGIDPAGWIAGNPPRTGSAPWFLLVEVPPLDVDPAALPLRHVATEITVPRLHPTEGYPRHPWVERRHRADPLDDRLDDPARQRLVATYFDQCVDLDRRVGHVLDALDTHGPSPTTRVIYTSLAGHNIGTRGVWRTPTLYDDHIAIPLLMADPDVPRGRRCRTPVSLLDLAATIAPFNPSLHHNLVAIAATADETTRSVVATCTGSADTSAAAMIRDGRFKYIVYEGFEPELFDLAADPGEEDNLAASPAHAEVRDRLDRRLRLEGSIPTAD